MACALMTQTTAVSGIVIIHISRALIHALIKSRPVYAYVKRESFKRMHWRKQYKHLNMCLVPRLLMLKFRF